MWCTCKAFVKGIVQFNGEHEWDGCIQKGDYSEGCMLFIYSVVPLRTDDFFWWFLQTPRKCCASQTAKTFLRTATWYDQWFSYWLYYSRSFRATCDGLDIWTLEIRLVIQSDWSLQQRITITVKIHTKGIRKTSLITGLRKNVVSIWV